MVMLCKSNTDCTQSANVTGIVGHPIRNSALLLYPSLPLSIWSSNLEAGKFLYRYGTEFMKLLTSIEAWVYKLGTYIYKQHLPSAPLTLWPT